MKILVTGGAGFIASHVVDKYIELGHDVVIVDNLSTGYLKNVNDKAKLYVEDICNYNLRNIIEEEQPDIVNHHAAQISVPVSVKDPLHDAEVNIKGTLNLLENCVNFKIKKVIFISSGGAIYGEADEYPTTENYLPRPLSPYAVNKYTTELYLHYYFKSFGLKFTTLRYANVYGPRQVPHGEAGVISIFKNKYLKNERPTLFAFPENPDGMIRDYVFVKDVVNANVLALDKGDNDAFNIGSGIETTTGELLREISTQMGVNYDPYFAAPRPGDIRRSCLNTDKAKQILNWSPTVSLPEGIKMTVKIL